MLSVWEGRGKKKVATLRDGWLERLRKIREHCGEIESDRLARRSVERQREAYRNRGKAPESKPSAAGLEAVRRSHAIRESRLREIARAEEERRKAGPPHELRALISEFVHKNDRLRMGLLCELATEEGFDWRDVPEAVRAMGCRVERLPEYGDEEFVFPLLERASAVG